MKTDHGCGCSFFIRVKRSPSSGMWTVTKSDPHICKVNANKEELKDNLDEILGRA